MPPTTEKPTSQILSGSMSGRPIGIAAIASPGTLIHVAPATAIDELWLWAVNTSGAIVKLSIELGGTAISDLDEVGISSEAGLVLVIPGLPLTGSSIVRAFADNPNLINIFGFANRIT